MSKASTITIQWSVVGDETILNTQAVQIVNADCPGEMVLIPVTIGRNSVFFPGPPTFQTVLIIPPINSVIVKTWDAGSTVGGNLSPNQPSLISVPSGSTGFNISASGSEVLKAWLL